MLSKFTKFCQFNKQISFPSSTFATLQTPEVAIRGVNPEVLEEEEPRFLGQLYSFFDKAGSYTKISQDRLNLYK